MLIDCESGWDLEFLLGSTLLLSRSVVVVKRLFGDVRGRVMLRILPYTLVQAAVACQFTFLLEPTTSSISIHIILTTMATPNRVRIFALTGGVAAITATGAWYGAGLKTRQEFKQVSLPSFSIQHILNEPSGEASSHSIYGSR